MISGKKNPSLQYSTKAIGKLDRLSIQCYEPKAEDHIKKWNREGKLTVNSKGYIYEPSEQYKKALKKFHDQHKIKRRTKI
jgi:hypothetical protein